MLGGRLRVRPGLSVFFNDPSGAFKYELYGLASYNRAARAPAFLPERASSSRCYETISDVTQPSNSELPHVRSDIAEYRKGSDFKLTRLLLNRFYHPEARVYGRLSAGIYEEMFSGFGGQALYLGRGGGWSADVAADWVRQRDFEGWFGHQDYDTITAIASLNYRMAHGVTGTVRAGRFLAKDEGVRVEVKRRFASGFEVGAWYTVTNGNDITSPGTPSNPYYDKGIFMAMPLDTLLTYDTQAVAGFALAPWTRDVGQMVVSPGDLARIVERPTVQMHSRDGLERFGDRYDDYDLPMLGADRRWPDLVAQDFVGARRAAGEVDWVKTTVLGAGIVLGAAAFDDTLFRRADKYKDEGWMKNLVRAGDALPLAAVGFSAMFAFDDSRPQLSETGIAALEASAAAFVAATGLKYGVGRARPDSGEAKNQFNPVRIGRQVALVPFAPHRGDVGRDHAVRQGVRHGVALRPRRGHQRRAHRQPRALVLRHRRRLRARLCARPPRVGCAPRQEQERADRGRGAGQRRAGLGSAMIVCAIGCRDMVEDAVKGWGI